MHFYMNDTNRFHDQDEYLSNLLFKIHEKIESLEKHEPQLKQGLGTIESLGQLKALKSLLDNKK